MPRLKYSRRLRIVCMRSTSSSRSASRETKSRFSELTIDLRGSEFGTLGFRDFPADECRQAAVRRRCERLHRRAAAGRRNGIEAGGTNGDDLDRILRLDRGERIARVDRPHESVGRLDRDDLRNLLHVEQGRDARCHVLAVRSGRRKDVRVTLRDRNHERSHVLREEFAQLRRVGVQYFRHALDLCRRLRCSAGIAARDENVDFAADLPCRGDRVARRNLEGAVIVLGNNEDRHVRSPWLHCEVCRPAPWRRAP